MGRLSLLGVGRPPVAAVAQPDFSAFGPYVLLWPDTFGVADGGAVGTAVDSSGNGADYTEATNKPTYHAADLNGHGTVEHDGVNDLLTGPSLTAKTSGHVFTVVKIDADPPVSGKQGLWTFNNAATGGGTHYPHTDGVIYENFGTTARKTVGNPTPALTSWRIYEVRSALNDWEAKLDGASLFSTASNVVAFPAAPLIGKDPENTHWLDGRWAFIGLFPALSSGNATTVRSGLQSYFAL